jgi:hypothetical protein
MPHKIALRVARDREAPECCFQSEQKQSNKFLTRRLVSIEYRMFAHDELSDVLTTRG